MLLSGALDLDHAPEARSGARSGRKQAPSARPTDHLGPGSQKPPVRAEWPDKYKNCDELSPARARKPQISSFVVVNALGTLKDVLHDPGLPLPALPALYSSGRVRGFDAGLCCDLVPCDISNTGAKLASSRNREKHPGLHITSSRPIQLPEARQQPCCNAASSESSTIPARVAHGVWQFYVDADVSSDFLGAAMLQFKFQQNGR